MIASLVRIELLSVRVLRWRS